MVEHSLIRRFLVDESQWRQASVGGAGSTWTSLSAGFLYKSAGITAATAGFGSSSRFLSSAKVPPLLWAHRPCEEFSVFPNAGISENQYDNEAHCEMLLTARECVLLYCIITRSLPADFILDRMPGSSTGNGSCFPVRIAIARESARRGLVHLPLQRSKGGLWMHNCFPL